MVGGARGIIIEVVLITCPNHDVSFTSIALITSACVGGHDANPINTISSNLEFALSSLAAPSDE
jgi:predicted Zn-ribbon and HTH transcriptional regulator